MLLSLSALFVFLSFVRGQFTEGDKFALIPLSKRVLGLYGPIIHYWDMKKKGSQTLFVSVFPGCFAANLLLVVLWQIHFELFLFHGILGHVRPKITLPRVPLITPFEGILP